MILTLTSVLALSTHGVFEGLAAGLEEDESGVWTMFTGQGICKIYQYQYYDDVQIYTVIIQTNSRNLMLQPSRVTSL